MNQILLKSHSEEVQHLDLSINRINKVIGSMIAS